MKTISILAIAVAALAAGALLQPTFTEAQSAARAFPNLTPVYRITGVNDTGDGSGVGIATSVHCTNFFGGPINIALTARSDNGTVVGTEVVPGVPANSTITISTHDTALFNEYFLSPGVQIAGSIVVFATRPQIHCTAMIVDASSNNPDGIALHMMRLNPAPGTVE